MTGRNIPLFTDEMIALGLAPALRQRGYDALSCVEAGRASQRIPDVAQLEFATGQGRAMLTFNMGDFLALDHEWKRTSREHAGIIVSPAVDEIGTLLRRVLGHLSRFTAAEQHNVLLWLDPIPDDGSAS
jgi:hypothetical protein